MKVNLLFKIANVALVLSCADFNSWSFYYISGTAEWVFAMTFFAIFLLVLVNFTNNILLIKKYETGEMLSEKRELFFWIVAWPFFILMIFASFVLIVMIYYLIIGPYRLLQIGGLHQLIMFTCIIASTYYLVFAQTKLYFKAKKNYVDNINSMVDDLANDT